MARYMRQVLCRKLATADPAVMLRPLAGSASHLALLELLATESAEHPEARKAVEFLLKSLPGSLLPQFLKLDAIGVDDRSATLAREITAQGALPPQCDWLWAHWAAGAGAADRHGARLVDVLAQLEAATLASFYRDVPPECLAPFFSALERGLRRSTATLESAHRRRRSNGTGRRGATLCQTGPGDVRRLSGGRAGTGGILRRVLDGLHDQTAEFSSRLDLLLAGQDLLPDATDRQLALAWSQCRQAILDLGQLQSQRGGWRRRRRPLPQIDAACQRMVEAARAAMPPQPVDDDPPGPGMERRLRTIGRCLLGEPLLPATHWHRTALGKKALWYFERGKWPGVPLASLRPKAQAQRQWRTQAAAVGLAFVILVAILLALLMTHSGARFRRILRSGAKHNRARSEHHPGTAPPDCDPGGVGLQLTRDSIPPQSTCDRPSMKKRRPSPLSLPRKTARRRPAGPGRPLFRQKQPMAPGGVSQQPSPPCRGRLARAVACPRTARAGQAARRPLAEDRWHRDGRFRPRSTRDGSWSYR